MTTPIQHDRTWHLAIRACALAGVTFGIAVAGGWLLQGCSVLPSKGTVFLDRFVNAGSAGYLEIAEDGYSGDYRCKSNVAFFPAYPLLGRWLSWVTGWSTKAALIAVAQTSFLASFILVSLYVRPHVDAAQPGAVSADEPGRGMRRVDILVLLAFGLWPTTVFFRMAYSESLFCLVAIGAMYGMQRRMHPLLVALLVGLGTATRPVGVALLGPFVLYLWERSRPSDAPALSQDRTAMAVAPSTEGARHRRLSRFIRSAVVCLPLASWGITSYMVVQYVTFGDPLAFVHTQQYWAAAALAVSEQWSRTLALEPIWSVYDPSSIAHWSRYVDAPRNPLFSLPFANPIYFLVSVVLVWLGWRRRWLNAKEVVLAALLLGIPYFTHGYRHLMLSQGRFASVAFPVYVVMGRLMARAPMPLLAVFFAILGFLLAVYAAEFAAGYRVG